MDLASLSVVLNVVEAVRKVLDIRTEDNAVKTRDSTPTGSGPVGIGSRRLRWLPLRSEKRLAPQGL